MIEKQALLIVDNNTEEKNLNTAIKVLQENSYNIVVSGKNESRVKDAVFNGLEHIYKNSGENVQVYILRLFNLKITNEKHFERQIYVLEEKTNSVLFPFQERRIRDIHYSLVEVYIKSKALIEKILLSKNLINHDEIDDKFQKIINRTGVKIEYLQSYKNITDVVKFKKKNHNLYNYIIKNVFINIFKGLNDVLIEEYNQPFVYIDRPFSGNIGNLTNENQNQIIVSHSEDNIKKEIEDNKKEIGENKEVIEEIVKKDKYLLFIKNYEPGIISYLKLKKKKSISVGFIILGNKNNERTYKSIEFQKEVIDVNIYNFKDVRNLKIKDDYVMFINEGDLLSPVFGIYLPEEKYDFIYFNEDVIEEGKRKAPFFKVDFSPNTLLSYNYIKNGFLISKEVFDKIKNSINENDFQLLKYPLIIKSLLFSESVKFIDKILYHNDIENFEENINLVKDKEYLFDVLNSFSEKYTGYKVKSFEEVIKNRFFNVRYNIEKEQKVSIIIPTKNNYNLLKDLIDSILNNSTYKNYEIIIVNNNSNEEKLLEYLSSLKSNYNFVKVIDYNYEFNQSKINNIASDISEGDFLIFLNNDMKVITEDQIERLIEKAQLKNIGTVGGLLYFDDNTIQHGGVIIGKKYLPQHLFYNEGKIYYDYFPFIPVYAERNVIGNTGACFCISKEKFIKVGKFNENLNITGNDVEFNIRCNMLGYYNLFDPNIELYHYESKSRKEYLKDKDDAEKSIFKYSELLLQGDKFYNINFDILKEVE